MTELLHVGSTIAAKRIDVLLRVLGRACDVSGRTSDSSGSADRSPPSSGRSCASSASTDSSSYCRFWIAPLWQPSTGAARSSCLPSEREGFGLPVLEALACGTPVIASDIDALREVGGDAVRYCPAEDVAAWTATIADALTERRERPTEWTARISAGSERAASFSWSRYTSEVAVLYNQLASPTGARS